MTNIEKKILFCTNSRSELSTVLSMYEAASASKKIKPMLMVGGTHLSEEYGMTVNAIKQKKIIIDCVADYYCELDEVSTSLGRATDLFTKALSQLNPEIVVITGDRLECIPLVTACLLTGVLVAHVSGGDTTNGAIDNTIRDIITKASHIHFVAMEEHAQKVRRMGEKEQGIFVTGDPAIDYILKMKIKDRSSVFQELGINENDKFILCTFHPQTICVEENNALLDNYFEFLTKCPYFVIFTYPNGDPGSEDIIKRINDFTTKNSKSMVVKSFNDLSYYNVLAHAEFLFGNSSSSIWEAPSFQTPALNIGRRQDGRFRAGNVIDVSGKKITEIEAAAQELLSADFKRRLAKVYNPYGEGKASEKIALILGSMSAKTLRENKVYFS